MCLITYTEAKARRAGSHLVTGCTGGCHFNTVRCGQGGRGLSLWWPYGLRFPDLVYILSFLFIMNITEMIGISLSIVLRCFHDLMFLLCWEIKNSWILNPGGSLITLLFDWSQNALNMRIITSLMISTLLVFRLVFLQIKSSNSLYLKLLARSESIIFYLHY